MTEIDWALLARYAAGDCDSVERAAVERRLLESPEHRDMLAVIRSVAAEARWSASGEVRQAHLRRVQERRARRRARWPAVAKVAATVALVLGGALVGSRIIGRSSAPGASAGVSVHTIATRRGERMSLRLADSTQVILGPSTTLRIPSAYGVAGRTVQLDGEAAFTVVHNERRPFAVRTSTFVARDLGTRFVVRAYATDAAAQLVVAEGKVGLDTLVLSPGDMARVTSSGVATARGVALDAYFAWTDGRLAFDRTPLGDVVRQIARWYDVEIRLASPELADRRVTSSFRAGELASEMVRVIATALNLEVIHTEPHKYILRAR